MLGRVLGIPRYRRRVGAEITPLSGAVVFFLSEPRSTQKVTIPLLV